LKQRNNITYYVIISTIAAVLILIVAFISLLENHCVILFDKYAVSMIFVTSLIFGLSIALYPGWIKRFFKKKKVNSNDNNQLKNRKYQGHHPDCNEFISHTIKIKKKIYCAGCFGLAIGAIISMLLVIIYIFIIENILSTLSLLFIVLGDIIIGFSFYEINKQNRNTHIHILSNILLVVSFFLITIGLLEITGDKIFGIIGIIFSFLWLDTRVQLSKWKHENICQKCKKSCKMY